MNQRESMFPKEVCGMFHASFSFVKELKNGFQNKIYEYESDGKPFILRLIAADRKTKEQIESELRWVRFLKENGVKASPPIPSINQEWVEKVGVEGTEYFACAFHKAEGAFINVSEPSQWNQAFFFDWGKTIGKMHKLSNTYNIEETRPTWAEKSFDPYGIMDSLPTDMQAKYTKHLTSLHTFSRGNEVFGLMHNDFHQGNFHVKNGEMILFDFDDCAYNWFANDLAVSFYHAYWQGTSFNPGDRNFAEIFLRPFFEGYRKEFELSDEILKQIPIFLKIRELYLYSLFSSRWNPVHMEEWQKAALINLRESILKEVPYAGIESFKEY
ncbi:phosphotransferase enzyme family protein [Falsibacillus pallidus]|uniref:phosphotransferase enzyme family protein n=1 Tax=Falsibacillus pallidus TaxID=493781 RepID=UPI003D9591F3